MRSTIPFILALGLALFNAEPTNSLVAQQLEAEFVREAPKSWLQLRTNAFKDVAIAMDRKSIRSSAQSPAAGTVRQEVLIRYKLYNENQFKYFESVLATDTNPSSSAPLGRKGINIYNPDQTFLLYKDPNSKWVRMSVDTSPRKLDFVEESISGAWFQKQRRNAVNAILAKLGQDSRLDFNGQPIEFFLKYYRQVDENCFQSFQSKEHEAFGRIVSIHLKTKPINVNIRSLKAAKSKISTAKLELLADWNWLPRKMTEDISFLDANGKQIGKRTRLFEATYVPQQVKAAKDSKSDLFPESIKLQFSSMPDKRSSETEIRIRKLTAKEIETIKQFSHLEDYGLSN